MKKLVNGKVIDIKNIELFDMALAGIAMSAKTVSDTSNTINSSIDNDIIAKVLKMYNAFYRSMPYPLYAIEDDIKYAALGSFIKHTQGGNNIVMFTDGGLYVVVDIRTMTAIHIVNNSWSIEHIDSIKTENVDIENYRDHVAYNEYSWLLNKVLKLDGKANFYEEFMPEFVKACNNEPMIIKWELQNMLNFRSIPEKIEIAENTIIDSCTRDEYTVDIYENGYINCKSGNTRWTIGDEIGQTYATSRERKYGYNVYKKDSDNKEQLKKCNAEWAASIFVVLCRVRSFYKDENFSSYRGVLCGSTPVYEINGSIYTSRKDGTKEISNCSEIYSVDKSDVYFKRVVAYGDIFKVGVYKYNIFDGKVSTCSIGYCGSRDEIS